MFVWVAFTLLTIIIGCLAGLAFVTHLRQTRIAMHEDVLVGINGQHPNTQLRAVVQLLNVSSPVIIDWYRREQPIAEPVMYESTYAPATELIPGPLILPIPYQRSLLYADDLSQMSGTAEDTTPMPRAS